jgi:WD40 repeat protein
MEHVAFSTDGRWLAGGGFNQTRVWDLKAGDPERDPLVLPARSVEGLAFTPDGRWLVTSSDNQQARLWSFASEKPASYFVTLRGAGSAEFLASSADGQYLVTGRGNTARLWLLHADDPAAGSIDLAGHDERIIDAVFSRDGRWLVTASADSTARVWDMRGDFRGPDPVVLRGPHRTDTIALSPDSRWLLAGFWDNTARLWSLRPPDPGKPPLTLKGHRKHVIAVAFSPDGRWGATASEDWTVRIWDLAAADPSAKSILLEGHDAAIESLAFSPDGHRLATAGLDGTARVWDLRRPAGRDLPGIELPHLCDMIRACSHSCRCLYTGEENRHGRVH